MDELQTKKILMEIQAVYPSWRPTVPIQVVVAAWKEALKDLPFDMAVKALRSYNRVNDSGFAPSPGQLLAQVVKLESDDTPSAIQAWGMVKKALRNSITDYGREFDRLPKIVQKTVGFSEQLRAWALMDGDKLELIVRRSFEHDYLQALEQRNQKRILNADYAGIRTEAAEPKRIETTEETAIKDPTKGSGWVDKSMKYHSPVADGAADRLAEKLMRGKSEQVG